MCHPLHLPMDVLPLILTADHSMDATASLHPERLMPNHVLLYVTQGRFSVVEDGVEYQVPERNMLFLHAGIRHYGIHPMSIDRKWYYIHFMLPAPYASDFSIAQLPVAREHEYTAADYRRNVVLPKSLRDENRSIERAIGEIVTLFASRDPLRHVECSLMLFSLLLRISITASEATQPRYCAHVERLIAHLESHLSAPIDAQEITGQFPLNYRYLSTLFKKETGTTIQQFHRDLRINKACHLLRHTSMNVQQVGNTVGYIDPCHFSHVFRSVKGIAPKEYMMQYRRMIEHPSRWAQEGKPEP